MNLVEALLPRRLGASFRWLFGASLVNNLGDGIAIAAGPLLVASQTHNPFLVSLAPLMQSLPQVVLGLHSGVLADRLDRKRMVVVGDLTRVAVLVALAATIVTGHVSIAVVLLAMLALGIAEVFTDAASRTLLPSSVPRAHLGAANQRLMGAMLTTNQFVGPPLGAFLFAAGMVWPFATTAICLALGAVLIQRMVVRRVEAGERTGGTVREDIREGLAWLWHHGALRTLAITIFVFNVTWGAAWSVLVLWARQRVGVDEVGFGLLTTMSGIGGLIGTFGYGWLARRVPGVWIIRVCLSLEVAMHLVMALTRSPLMAFATMLVFGTYAFVWGTLSGTIRQRAVPHRLQGRVGSVMMLATMLGMVVGTPLGGALATRWGITAPNWFAFVGAGVTLVLIWRQLRHVAHAGDEDPDADGDDTHSGQGGGTPDEVADDADGNPVEDGEAVDEAHGTPVDDDTQPATAADE